MSTSDYREAWSYSPRMQRMSEEELHRVQEQLVQKNNAIDELTHVAGSVARVPIRDAVTKYRAAFSKRYGSCGNSDRYLAKSITTEYTLTRLLTPRKDNGRWTVNGTVLHLMEEWMWIDHYAMHTDTSRDPA